jgi:hypothetical protein
MSDFKLVKLLGNPVQITVSIVPRGVYSAITQYNVGDSVSYGVSSYVAMAPTIGNVPTNTAYWQLLAEGMDTAGIEDIVGAMVTDTATIDMTYNSGTKKISSDIVANSITDTQVNKISLTKIEDAQNKNYESSVLTTNNVVTNILAVNCAVESSILMEAKFVARRTGGTAGTAGDGATFIRSFRVKSIGGVVTIHDIQSDFTSKDNSLMNVSFAVVGTNVELRVRGVSNNNIQWVLNLITSVNS